MNMGADGSVTAWFQALQGGDQDAAHKLWERFSERLLGVARRKLLGTPRQAADEEDVVLSAFVSFCQAAQAGELARLEDRADLWHLLVVITGRKAINLRVHGARLKRGGQAQYVADEVENLASREPDPEVAALFAEEYTRLLGLLDDPELRDIALKRVEGHTDEEIARALGCTRRTVVRRVGLIRRIWERELS